MNPSREIVSDGHILVLGRATLRKRVNLLYLRIRLDTRASFPMHDAHNGQQVCPRCRSASLIMLYPLYNFKLPSTCIA